VTFASRLKFLTVRVGTPLSGGCVLIDSVLGSCPPIHRRLDPSLAIFPYPSLDALLLSPLCPPSSSPLLLSSSSIFHSLKTWLLFPDNLCRFLSLFFCFSLAYVAPLSLVNPFTMAQSRSRAPLQPSYTFSASLGIDPTPPVLKRHFTAEDLQPASNSMLPAASSQAFSASDLEVSLVPQGFSSHHVPHGPYTR
jgi:hypothetical protein